MNNRILEALPEDSSREPVPREPDQDEIFRNSVGKHFPPHLVKEIINEYPKFKNIKYKKLMRRCTNQSAFLYGPAGTGKTFFAIMAVIFSKKSNWWYLDRSVNFWSVSALMNEIRKYQQPGSDQEEYEKLLFSLRNPMFLILDDLGSGSTTNFTNDTLFSIIDHRYSNKYKTLVTSNLNPQELQNQNIDGRIMSRILNMAGDKVLRFSKQFRNPDKITPIEVK